MNSAQFPAIEVHVFPSDDFVLAQRVEQLLGRGTLLDLDAALRELQDRLQEIYPDLSARPRSELAEFGQHAIYVFRDGGRGASTSSDGWTSAETTGRLVTDASGDYVEANEAAAAMFGVESPNELIGRHAGDFTPSDARLDRAALWHALEVNGRLHSMTVLKGPNARRRVEFIAVRDGDGPERNVIYLRELENERGAASRP